MIAPRHRIKLRKNGNIQRSVELRELGKSFDEIGAELGISPQTARIYVRNSLDTDSREYKGTEPRCQCGLLLPCTCVGAFRAEDFMRSGQPSAGGTIALPHTTL